MKGSINISVIIPVYNQTESLAVVLRFFEFQTLPLSSFEVIVIDDGSNEPITAQLNTSNFNYQLKIIEQANGGRAVARNKGVEHASGALLVFCDGDRIPDASFLERHAFFHHNNKNTAAFGCPKDCFVPLRKLTSFGKEHLGKMNQFSREPEYYKAITQLYADGATTSSISWASFLVGNASLQKIHFEQSGGFNPAFKTWGFEHFELALRLVKIGLRICHLPAAINFHIPHPRPAQFYQKGVEESMSILKANHPNQKVGLLEDFLLGTASLQQFEQEFGGAATDKLTHQQAIFYGQLASTNAF